jgi:hypothetical protein
MMKQEVTTTVRQLEDLLKKSKNNRNSVDAFRFSFSKLTPDSTDCRSLSAASDMFKVFRLGRVYVLESKVSLWLDRLATFLGGGLLELHFFKICVTSSSFISDFGNLWSSEKSMKFISPRKPLCDT